VSVCDAFDLEKSKYYFVEVTEVSLIQTVVIEAQKG
jgi:hypothetical protein